MPLSAIQESPINFRLFNIRFVIRFLFMIILTILFLKWFRKFYRNRKIYNQMPTIPSTRILGNILGHLEYFWTCRTHLTLMAFFVNIGLGLTKLFHQKNLGIFYFRIGPSRNIVMVVKARAAEVILSSRKNIVKSDEYDFIKPWLGEGLLTGKGQQWRSHRKLLIPTFHFEVLEKFLPIMNSKVNVMLDLIGRSYDKTTGVIHIPDIRPYLTNSAVDIICETAMGIKMSSQEDWWAKQKDETVQNTTPGSKYAEDVRTYLAMLVERLVSPWMYNDFLFSFMPLGKRMKQKLQELHGFTNDVIIARKAELEEKLKSSSSVDEMVATMNKRKRIAFLDLILEYHLKNPNEMDLKSVREEVDTFMFGGHDTTSTTLHFAFLLIGLNIAAQQKIQEELDYIFDGEEREITLDDTKRMTYLEMAIREVLRLYPAQAFFGRKVVEEHTMDGHIIPAGTTIMLFSYAIHRDPEIYDDPECFIPERFEPNSKVSKNSFGYIAFSAGLRQCPGQRFAMLELKIVLATILRKYNLRTLTKQELVEVDMSAMSKTNTPIEVEFTERQTYITIA